MTPVNFVRFRHHLQEDELAPLREWTALQASSSNSPKYAALTMVSGGDVLPRL